jgi:aminoglycoside 6-adenylyltransferase
VDVLAPLVAWAEAEPAVRALILTSTRARPDGPVDELSDYDVIVLVDDVPAFVRREAWLEARPGALARWGDESERLGERTVFRGVVYADGTKIDWSIWPAALLELVGTASELPHQLDVGYRVLLDKEGRSTGWPPATHRAHIPHPPTSEEYRALVEEFWWSTTYVAKALWRGEVVFAKFALDTDAKLGALRPMLEWLVELGRDWSWKPGAYGRGLEQALPEEVRGELEATYVGAGIEENWDALFRTTALFRRAAREVGDALGFVYPQDVDDGVSAQLERVRALATNRT